MTGWQNWIFGQISPFLLKISSKRQFDGLARCAGLAAKYASALDSPNSSVWKWTFDQPSGQVIQLIKAVNLSFTSEKSRLTEGTDYHEKSSLIVIFDITYNCLWVLFEFTSVFNVVTKIQIFFSGPCTTMVHHRDFACIIGRLGVKRLWITKKNQRKSLSVSRLFFRVYTSPPILGGGRVSREMCMLEGAE